MSTGRPQGFVLAQWGLAGAAIVTIAGVGFDLAPSSVYHWLRWQATIAYCVYAGCAIALVRTRR
jgi:hypothetical protein